MNQTQKGALQLVLEMAQSYVNFPPSIDGEQEAVDTLQAMLDEANKVDVNPEPLIDQVEGPILVADFLKTVGHNLSAEAATASCLITFHRRGSGPHAVTNPNGSFIVGDFVTCGGRTYSITGE